MKKSKVTNTTKPESPSDPRQTHGLFKHSTHSIEALEKALAGLPMKAASKIDFSEFKKLPNQPYGHIRYTVHDSMDTYLGYIAMERHGENATTITFDYKMKYFDTFEKIRTEWDKQIAYDVEISNISKAKIEALRRESMRPADPSIPESIICPKKNTKRFAVWRAAWRKVSGRYRHGDKYSVLARLADVSESTIAKIVKAGEVGLLD
jgi:hypothetical protein